MLDKLLGPWKYLLYAAMIAAFIGGVVHEKHSYDDRRKEEGAAPYREAIEKQKREAELVLAAEIAKNKAISEGWINYARSSDNEYTKEIAAIRASVNVGSGVRFTDPGRRPSGGCPAAPASSAGAPQDAPASGQLSGEASAFLRSEAARADELVVWAKSCHAYANTK